MRELGVFGVARDFERPLLGLKVLGAHSDHRVLLDVVALFLARLDLLGQPGEAFRVECVGRVEQLDIGLVERGE
ncbi:MAG: hypothetical protein QM744_00725 [Mesorhizobium sp.]